MRVQLLFEDEDAFVLHHVTNLALGIEEVPELARAHRTHFDARRIAPLPHPLDAERALLDHTDFPDRDIGIQGQFQGPVPDRVSEVEEADVIGTGIGAVPCSDAAVIDLGVQSFFGMVAGKGRTDRFTRCGIAVLAHDRAELDLHLRKVAFVVALDPDPGDRPAACRLFGSGNPDVVFRAAGRHTGFTARAAVQVYGHSPAV